MDQLSHVAWLFQGGGYALYKKFFSDALKLNIEPFMVQPMGPDPLGWFKAPINSLEDMKKLKYRSPPGLVGEIFKEMGVNAVAMPGGEIVPAAQRGVLDASATAGANAGRARLNTARAGTVRQSVRIRTRGRCGSDNSLILNGLMLGTASALSATGPSRSLP